MPTRLPATLLASALVAPAATVVYVSHAEGNEIRVLLLDRNSGALGPLQTVSLPGVIKPGQSTPMAVSPDRRFLFVATRGEPQMVLTFGIDRKTGRLEHLGHGPLPDSMAYIATDRTGHQLFAASYPGHKITVSPINAAGVVQAPQQVLAPHPNAHSIQPDASNRFVLAMTLGDDRINVFRFDPKTGRLTPNDPAFVTAKTKTGPRHFAFHPNGKFVYVLGELDAQVHVFAYDAAKGQLTPHQSINALPLGTLGRIAAADLHVSPDGQFLYASERTSSTLAGFKIDPATGTLAFVEFVPTETQPRTFAIDSSSRFLFVAGQRSHRLSSYRIAKGTGRLEKIAALPMGQNPNWIEVVDLP